MSEDHAMTARGIQPVVANCSLQDTGALHVPAFHGVGGTKEIRYHCRCGQVYDDADRAADHLTDVRGGEQ